MTARVLIVDDLLPNLKLLQAKLMGEYYEVITTMSGVEALELAKNTQPDIILLDAMMPIMDGYETCRRLKSDPTTTYIPVVMVTALDDTEENRVNGLSAGADDFLTKPINDMALFARIRSLTRLKIIIDQIRLRGQTNLEMSDAALEVMDYSNQIANAKILLVDEDGLRSQQLSNTLHKYFKEIVVLHDPEQAVTLAINGDYDLIITDITFTKIDGLRLFSQLRSNIETRYTPILVMLEDDNTELIVKSFDIGVNDYIIFPVSDNELIARANSQVKRKRYQDALKRNLDDNIAMSTTDPLTGCYNRRYFDTHFKHIVQDSFSKNKKLSLLMIDIDYFKDVNDTFGHTSGDEILKEVQQRISYNVRITDLVARFGGEEFAVILPDTAINEAKNIAERVCAAVEGSPFHFSDGNSINKTISIGVATLQSGDDLDIKYFINRADKCLYEAKNGGRNNVVSAN